MSADQASVAKLGVLAGSILAAVVGSAVLYRRVPGGSYSSRTL
jgi:Na+/H+ antiporter NhaA